jgi:hypothetical protein
MLERQKNLMFIYPIYYHNWRNISTVYIYITRLASNEIFSPSNKIHREVGPVKDLSAPRYVLYRYHIEGSCMFPILMYYYASYQDPKFIGANVSHV